MSFSSPSGGFHLVRPTRHAYHTPSTRPATISLTNEVYFTKTTLLFALHDLSSRLLHTFGHQVRLLVHGGAVMVLHSQLGHRETTRDVDYVHRAFAADYASTSSQQDAELRLRRCIAGTAAARGLGADWMNAAPDVALPMARDAYGRTYDPVYTSFLVDAETEEYTLFTAPGLHLVAVNWAWALAFKLVRYEKNDPRDVQAIIRMLSCTRGGRWDATYLERWVTTSCWPMGYSTYAPPQREQLRRRIDHAVRLAHGPV